MTSNWNVLFVRSQYNDTYINTNHNFMIYQVLYNFLYILYGIIRIEINFKKKSLKYVLNILRQCHLKFRMGMVKKKQ